MKYELKSIGLWAFIKVAFLVNLLAGLVGGFFAVPLVVIMAAAARATAYGDPSQFYPEGGTLGALVVGVPAVCGFGGAVVGTFFQAIVILAYNLIARLAGGLVLTLQPDEQGPSEPVATKTKPPAWRREIIPPPPPPNEVKPKPPDNTPSHPQAETPPDFGSGPEIDPPDDHPRGTGS
jgi:hypothetical protein